MSNREASPYAPPQADLGKPAPVPVSLTARIFGAAFGVYSVALTLFVSHGAFFLGAHGARVLWIPVFITGLAGAIAGIRWARGRPVGRIIWISVVGHGGLFLAATAFVFLSMAATR